MERAGSVEVDRKSRLTSSVVWPKEVDLLLACSRLRLEEGDAHRIRGLLQGELDWNRFIRLTVLHCMTAFVFRHLEAEQDGAVPARVLQFLRNRFLQDGAAALRNTSHLLELLQLFREQDILAVPYKGPALAVALYGNVAFRRCNDLDILVSRGDVPRARELLEEHAFAPFHPTTPASREFLLQRRHSEIFTREQGPIVELHWAFAKQRGIFPLDLDMLRSRLREMTLAGTRVPVFAPEDKLLILSAHGANHLWSRLEWLTGIAELIRSTPLTWPQILERARELNSEKSLFLGLLLSGDLLEAPVPGELLAKGRANRDVVWAANLVMKKFATGQIERPDERSSIERDMFRLRMQSTNSARMGYLFHRIFTPGRDDTRLMLPIGKRFVPFPAFFRPLLLLAKIAGRALPRSKPGEEKKH